MRSNIFHNGLSYINEDFINKISNLIFFQQEQCEAGESPSGEMEDAVAGVLRSCADLRDQLQQTTVEQATDLGTVINAGHDLLGAIRNMALASDPDRLEQCGARFHEYIEHILEVNFIPCFILHSIPQLDTQSLTLY